VLRAVSGYVVTDRDITGIIHIEHNGATEQGLDGMRITALVRMETLLTDPDFKSSSSSSSSSSAIRWLSAEEIKNLSGEGNIREDLGTLLPGLLSGTFEGAKLQHAVS